MAAYMVFMRDKMLDLDAYTQYLHEAAPTLASYQGEILVLNGANTVLEGEAIDGAVILRFPDTERAQAWYNSPEYRAVKDKRIQATVGRAVLLDGLDSVNNAVQASSSS